MPCAVVDSVPVAGTSFAAYGPSHLAAIAVLGVGIVAILRYARWARRKFDRAFSIAIVVLALPMQFVQFTPNEWDFHTLRRCRFSFAIGLTWPWTSKNGRPQGSRCFRGWPAHRRNRLLHGRTLNVSLDHARGATSAPDGH